MSHLVIYPERTPIFKWCMVRCGSKNNHHNNMTKGIGRRGVMLWGKPLSSQSENVTSGAKWLWRHKANNVPYAMVPLSMRYPWMSSIACGYETHTHTCNMDGVILLSWCVSLNPFSWTPESRRLNAKNCWHQKERGYALSETIVFPNLGTPPHEPSGDDHTSPLQCTLCYGSALDEMSSIGCGYHTYIHAHMDGVILLLWSISNPFPWTPKLWRLNA